MATEQQNDEHLAFVYTAAEALAIRYHPIFKDYMQDVSIDNLTTIFEQICSDMPRDVLDIIIQLPDINAITDQCLTFFNDNRLTIPQQNQENWLRFLAVLVLERDKHYKLALAQSNVEKNPYRKAGANNSAYVNDNVIRNMMSKIEEVFPGRPAPSLQVCLKRSRAILLNAMVPETGKYLPDSREDLINRNRATLIEGIDVAGINFDSKENRLEAAWRWIQTFSAQQIDQRHMQHREARHTLPHGGPRQRNKVMRSKYRQQNPAQVANRVNGLMEYEFTNHRGKTVDLRQPNLLSAIKQLHINNDRRHNSTEPREFTDQFGNTQRRPLTPYEFINRFGVLVDLTNISKLPLTYRNRALYEVILQAVEKNPVQAPVEPPVQPMVSLAVWDKTNMIADREPFSLQCRVDALRCIFLCIDDPNIDPAIKAHIEETLAQQLFEIQRTHNEDDSTHDDAPSCPNGTIGRLFSVFESHPLFQPKQHEMVQQQVHNLFKKLLRAELVDISKANIAQAEKIEKMKYLIESAVVANPASLKRIFNQQEIKTDTSDEEDNQQEIKNYIVKTYIDSKKLTIHDFYSMLATTQDLITAKYGSNGVQELQDAVLNYVNKVGEPDELVGKKKVQLSDVDKQYISLAFLCCCADDGMQSELLAMFDEYSELARNMHKNQNLLVAANALLGLPQRNVLQSKNLEEAIRKLFANLFLSENQTKKYPEYGIKYLSKQVARELSDNKQISLALEEATEKFHSLAQEMYLHETIGLSDSLITQSEEAFKELLRIPNKMSELQDLELSELNTMLQGLQVYIRDIDAESLLLKNCIENNPHHQQCDENLRSKISQYIDMSQKIRDSVYTESLVLQQVIEQYDAEENDVISEKPTMLFGMNANNDFEAMLKKLTQNKAELMQQESEVKHDLDIALQERTGTQGVRL